MKPINIVGAGLAGLSAAIWLAERGAVCNLISRQPSERAQSVLAEGGINAALDTMGEGDTADEHFQDTMRGGGDLADPNAVRAMTAGAPEIVNWLLKLGAPLQKANGRVLLRNFGGQKKKRTAYARSSTGKMLMSALIDEARKWEAAGRINRYSHHEALDLVFQEEKERRCCLGVKLRDLYSNQVWLCSGPVILAVGGLNGFFPGQTTGTVYNTGNLAARLFVRGVTFSNLEMIQYHPTTAAIAGKRLLISEAARGEGGRLFIRRGGQPWHFMEELYPELGNLAARDVISREMVKVCAREDCEGPVYLDLTALNPEVWRYKLPDLRSQIQEYLFFDPAACPIAVSPGIHFFMGGIWVDKSHRTDTAGLYAAGECACQYHGANRLGGNSLLAAIYGGRQAAAGALADLPEMAGDLDAAWQEANLSQSRQMTAAEIAATGVSPAAARRLGELLSAGLGMIRTEAGLLEALRQTEVWLAEEGLSAAEAERIRLGQAMLMSALERRESRGAHWREDYPARDEAYRRMTVACYRSPEIAIGWQNIPPAQE